MLINDKSQLKRNVEQIGFQLALKTSKSLSWSDWLRQTVDADDDDDDDDDDCHMWQLNAAYCDEVVRIEEKVARVKEERRQVFFCFTLSR